MKMADSVLKSEMEKLNLQDQGDGDLAELENEASQDPVVKVLFYPKLLDNIFKFLDLKSLLVAQEVCETWHDVSKLSLERRLCMRIETRKLPPVKFAFGFRNYELGVTAEPLSSEEGHDDSEHPKMDSEEGGEGESLPSEVDTTTLMVIFQCLPPARQKYRQGLSAQWQTILESHSWILSLSYIAFRNVLTVQEWNSVWPVVLRDFKGLMCLNLTLPWYPDEKPLKQVEMTSSEAVPNGNLQIVKMYVVVDKGSTAKFGGGIDMTFLDMCPELKSVSLSYLELEEERSHCMCSASELISLQTCIATGSDEPIKPWELVVAGPGLSGEKLAKTNPEIYSAIRSEITYLTSTHRVASLQLIRELSFMPFSASSAAADLEQIKLITYDYASFDFANLGFLENLPKLNDVTIFLARKDINEPTTGKPAVPARLESVQRLELGLSNFGAEELGQISSTLFEMMPNAFVLITRSMRVNVDPEFALEEGLEKPGVDAAIHSDLLNNLSKLKKLKHYIWDWTLTDSFNEAFLNQVTECLSKCEALETLTVRFGEPSEGLKPRLNAIVDGCSKAPKLRALWIFLDESEELVDFQQAGSFPDFVRFVDSRLDFTSFHDGQEWLHLEEPLPDQGRLVFPLELEEADQ